ncbi:MAG TPA: TOMM precursor leader peptide-binding protein [Frankiaceae bacterium]|nr:TOMM precursor leader peptide-binding protein [Frankiaceae bacterium]
MGDTYVAGSGRLRDAVVARLGECHAGDADAAPAGSVVVSVADRWDPDTEVPRQRDCRERGVHLLHARLDGSLAFVGPWVSPRRPGCVACAEVRRRVALGASDTAHALAGRPARPGGTAPWVDVVAGLVVDALGRRTTGSVYVLRGDDLTGRPHSFLPVPACPHCGGLPADSPALAEIRLEPRPAESSGFRVSRTAPDAGTLRAALHDWRYGVVAHAFRSAAAPLALSMAELPVLGQQERTGGHGRADTFDEAEAVALLEALERYAGWAPGARRTSVVGSYAELADDAVDPARLGLPDPGERTGFPPYSPGLRMPWVWAWSLTRGRAVLVPECVAYYGSEAPWRAPGRVRYCADTSNGCALGASVEEAVVHGLFEVAERDGFLLTWHRAATVPEIDVASVPDDLTRTLADRAACAGYDLRLFDVTTDLDIPSVWGLLWRRDGRAPASFSAAGSSPDPVKAVRGAVIEVVVDLFDRLPEERRPAEETLRAMCADDHLVRAMDDHIDLYTHPAAAERFGFLLEPRDAAALGDLYDGFPERWRRADLRDTVTALVAHLAGLGLEVLVVDQTTPEQRSLGLRCVKVLVPGTVPVTFGHANRRLYGIPRLLTGPRGRDERALRYADLNHRPHPFP